MAFAYKFVHAENGAGATRGLHKIWINGIDHDKGFVRRERWPVLSNFIWLDGSRVSVRADQGKNLGAVEFLNWRA